MKKPKLEEMNSLMIDHIDGKLTGELGKYVERHIEKHPEALREYNELKEVINLLDMDTDLDVPAKGKSDFLAMLEKQKAESSASPKIRKLDWLNKNTFYRVAAAVTLILVGYLGSLWVDSIRQSDFQVLENELNDMKELVIKTMMKQESASERIQGVLTVNELKEPDEEILNALITTMNYDDNVNVRMAALEALTNFAEYEIVKNAFIQALLNQDNPTIQIKLISILVNMEEKRAVDPIQKMIDDENTSTFVKDEAQYGLYQLL